MVDIGMVTVVVPVYQTEKYLDRCMESIVRQTYGNLQIILVDDGSPDSCPQKCEDWAKKDSRIKVIHKANAGLGMARNTGIEHAEGEYICFFDSDDYIALDTIENAAALAKRDASDLVLFGMNIVDSSGKIRRTYCPYTEKTVYEGVEIQDFVLPNMIEGSSKAGRNFNLNMSSCACLFSMKLIAECHWRFVSERQFISEDYYSLLHLYAYVQRVSVLKQACYFYCHNASSLTRVFRADRFEKICHCYSSMLRVCREQGFSERIAQSLSAQFLGNTIGAMKMIVALKDLSVFDKAKYLKQIVNSDDLAYAQHLVDLSTETRGRKILIYAMKIKSVALIYIMIKIRLWMGKH